MRPRDEFSINHFRPPLALSQMTGQNVRDADGRVLGRLADITVDLDRQAGPHLVERLVVTRRRAPDLLLPWTAVERFDHSCVTLRDGVNPNTYEVHLGAGTLRCNEILLVRDVLDTQIVDVVGQRLARVADVELFRTVDGELELLGVEVGFDAVLRRLSLYRLATHARRDAVAWTDLHLTSDRGHAVQLATPRSAVHHLDAAGLAALIDRLDTEAAANVLTAAGPRAAAGMIPFADPDVGERVLRSLPDEGAEIVAAMPPEHAMRWRARLARTPAFRGRHFIRSRVWPRRRRSRSRVSAS